MFLWHIFLVKPFAAISLVVCLVTIFFLFQLHRKRPEHKADRFLIAFLGLMSVYEGLRILQEAGILNLRANSALDDTIELLIVCCYLIAALVLKLSNVNHMDALSAMRLLGARPPNSTNQNPASPMDYFRDKDASTLETLNWAIPHLSDGAFKLYSLLCLRVDRATGRVPLGVNDVRLALGKTRDDLESYLHELEKAGAVSLRRSGNSVNIEILARDRQSEAAAPEEFERHSVAYAGPRAG
jgi:hypothetical protein